jgi:hypothetical protein
MATPRRLAMAVELPPADEVAIASKIEAITVFMSETESFIDSDIKDMFTDTLACISLIVFGTETP